MMILIWWQFTNILLSITILMNIDLKATINNPSVSVKLLFKEFIK